MELLFVIAFFVLTASSSSVAQNETTLKFNCSKLLFEIPIDCRHDYEISINTTNVVIVRKCKITAAPPFRAKGNASVALDQCGLQFTLRIIYDEKSKDEESTIHYQCVCDHTPGALTTPQTTPPTDGTGLITGLITGLTVFFLVVAGVIAFIGYRFRGRCRSRRLGDRDVAYAPGRADAVQGLDEPRPNV